MMRNYLLYIGLFLLFGCTSGKKNTAIGELESWLGEHDNDYSYCVIIPGAGCEGCILNTEYFAKEYSGRSDILFIFTRIETLKLLKHKLGKDISLSDNILYDTDNRFELIEKGENIIYPVVCHLKKNVVTDWCYISPEQRIDVIGKLREELDATPAHIIRLDDYLQDRSDKGITLGRMADRLEYVPLQTPDSLPVDIPMSVKVAGESVFVLDRTQTLFRFDRNGRFINRIGNRGEGPEDYVGTVDMEVDDRQEVVYVFDIYRHKLLEYDWSGNFRGSRDLPENIVDVTLKGNGCFVGYQPWYRSDDKVDRLVLFGNDGRHVETVALPQSNDVGEVKVDIFRIPEFYNGADRFYVRMPSDATLYELSDGNRLRKDICIEQGGYRLPGDIASNTALYNRNLNAPYLFELNVQRMRNWVFLSFFYRQEHYRVVYDISSRSFHTVFRGRYPTGITNDIDDGASFWPLWVSEGMMIGCISPEMLDEDYPDGSIQEKYREFQSYDNPVLQIIQNK